MKKLLIIPALCLMFLAMQGSTGTDFTEIVDSLKRTTDTNDAWDIEGTYNTAFKHQYLIWKDTGASFTDSAKVYGTDSRGNKFLCQLENLSAGSVTKSAVTNTANATTIYKIIPEYLSDIEIVWNGNAIYTASIRGDYTIRLVNE